MFEQNKWKHFSKSIDSTFRIIRGKKNQKSSWKLKTEIAFWTKINENTLKKKNTKSSRELKIEIVFWKHFE